MLLAFLYRQRGMHEDSTNTTEARLFYWALPILLICTLLAWLYHFPLWCGTISGVMAFIGILLGHSFAQSNTKTQYAEMGLVCFTRLELMLLPFLTAPVFGWYPFHPIFFLVIGAFFFLTWGASALSYSAIFQSKTLRLFGVNWCVPGDSSWEEWLVGLSYDIAFWTLILTQILGS